MASIIREPNGRRTIQFSAADSTRKSIRLGKVSQSVADKVKVKIEHLIAATVSGFPMDNETAQWLAVIGDNLAAVNDDDIVAGHLHQLGKFIESYIRQRTDVKSSTRRNLLAARSKLVEFYGEDKCLRDITPGDADAWKTWLKSRYAAGTTGRAIKFGKQFFRVAKRRRLVAENPFDEVKAPAQVNESRKAFISREDSQKVVDACPDHEWKLIFALSRYGGLRCPSETLALRWVDVDWERDRFWVPSPKTEGHEGHEGRWVPMFPELRPFLAAAFELAGVGAVHVVSRYRDPAKNFRTRMLRIIKRAGLKPCSSTTFGLAARPSWPEHTPFTSFAAGSAIAR